jgi:hypothetical protein
MARSKKKSSKKCPGLSGKGRLKKGYKHRKGGLKKGCPIKAKG